MTLPRFDINDFPIETDQPQIEVTLPVGRHVLELVVEDSAGLRSAPATVVITVEQSPPVISRIQPSSGIQGSTVRAQIQGENLSGASQVRFSGSGVTASILPGGDDSTIPIDISVSSQASPGGRSFTVTTPGGTAESPAGVVFTVGQGVPTIRSIEPTGGVQDTRSLRVTIAGENLAGAQEVTFSGTGITINGIVSSSAGSVVADIAIAANAAPSARTFSVTTPGGRANSPPGVEFSVRQGAPSISNIEPTSVAPGDRVTATIRGSNLSGATQVEFSGSGVRVDRISGSSASSVAVDLSIDSTAAPGARSFTVTTPGGTASSPSGVSLTVRQAGPVIDGIQPNQGFAGQSVNAIITGRNLTQAQAITFSGGGVTASIGSGGNDTRLPVTVNIAASAAVGERSFVVRTPQGQANSADSQVTFRVISIIPTIIPTISPTISPTFSPTFSPTLSPTISPTISPTFSPTFSPTAVPTLRPIINTATTSPLLDARTRIIASSNTQPVDIVSGIGPTFRERLESGGINTVGDLANADPEEVARLLGSTEVRAMGFIDAARNM